MKYSTLWLSLLAAMSAQAAEPVTEQPDEGFFSGYSLQEAKPAKTKKWKCNDCEQAEGWTGEMGVSAGYGDNDGASRFNNWVPTIDEQGMAGIFNADARLQGEGSSYTKLKAKDIGLERFGLAMETGNYDGVRLNVGYSETPYYWSNDGKTVYHGSDNLLQAGSLESFDKEVTRKKVTAGLAYTPKSPWRPHASFSHEVKEGTLANYMSHVPGVGSVPGLAPKPIEGQETTLMKAGVSYQAEQWLVDLSYDGSLFRNQQYAALYYQDGTSQSERAYEPDNDFHQLALSGQYQMGNHFFNGRVLSNRATSSGSFNAFTATTTVDGFEGDIETFQADGRWVGRMSRDLTLRANAEYRDRDDQSDRDVVMNGEKPQSTDRSHTKLGLAADYRLARGLKLVGGYDYLEQHRDSAEREQVDENTLYVKTVYRPAAAWQADAKLAYSTRDGSDWSRDDGYNGTGPSLRPFYLADRDRLELRADVSYQISDDLESTANMWWAKDEYKEGDIGRSEGEDYGYDLGLNYRLSERTDGHVFLNQQWISSSQNHANSDAPTWNPYYTDIADSVTTVGLGVSHKTESDIELGLDYSYSYGKGETNASAGVDYGDNRSEQHRVELYSTYPLSENQSLRWDLRYESFKGDDFLLSGEQASMGGLDDDYNAYFTSVSWQYKF